MRFILPLGESLWNFLSVQLDFTTYIKKSAEENLKENIISLPKEKKYFVVTDDDGNIKGYFPIKDKNLGKDWLALYQDPSLWLAQQNMTGEQYRVLFLLFNKLDFNNFLQVSRQEISEMLKIHPSNVSKAMKVLKEKNIIVEGPPAGKFKTYRLNPYIAHKGKNRNENILEFESALSEQGKNFFDADIKPNERDGFTFALRLILLE